ncbi:MAG: hypothetical protein FWE70_01200 [Oscillospiraceae bacterium]|nr:hypothetical protein [Oscillospiraceae bacterium]
MAGILRSGAMGPADEDYLYRMHIDASFDVADADSLATSGLYGGRSEGPAGGLAGAHGPDPDEDHGRLMMMTDEERESYVLERIRLIKAAKNPPKVPKMYVANHCVFDCSYCGHRCSNGHKSGYVGDPKVMAEMAVREAHKNRYGIFISSAIHRCPDYTEELIAETVRRMRVDHGYKGYIHAKVMPGTDPMLIERVGWYADRLSINIELPSSEGYKTIAKQKNRDNILGPMGEISRRIKGHAGDRSDRGRRFAKSGQTTQMILGIMGEPARVPLLLAEALYRKYGLRRVYYTNFCTPRIADPSLPGKPTPRWANRRMYQADRLLELYKFRADDILPECAPDLERDVDPKAAWALRNLDRYPIEVNKADYEELITIPGIGITSANKIVEARRYAPVTHEMMRKMRISLKRAKYFITCKGKYIGGGVRWDRSPGGEGGAPTLRDMVRDVPDRVSEDLNDDYASGFACCD